MDYIYISSGNFGAQALQHLNPKPTLVITMNDRLGGRGMKELIQTPVKKLSIELKIPFVEVENKQGLVSIFDIRYSKFVILLSDFRLIIPSELLKINEYGIWNIHPSLLPQYRGTTPIQTALINGEKVTGVTLMQMDEKIDHGPILGQEKINIDINDTNITLQGKLAIIGAHLFNKIASNDDDKREREEGIAMQSQDQDHSQATFTKKLTKEDGFIPLAELATFLEPLFKKYNLLHLLKGKDVIAKLDISRLKQSNTHSNSLDVRRSTFDVRLHNTIRALTPWPSVWTKLADDSVVKITGSKFDGENQQITITGIERNGKKYLFT